MYHSIYLLVLPQAIFAIVLCVVMWRRSTYATIIASIFMYAGVHYLWRYFVNSFYHRPRLIDVEYLSSFGLVTTISLLLFGMILLWRKGVRSDCNFRPPKKWIRLQLVILLCITITVAPAILSLLTSHDSSKITISLRWKMILVPFLSFICSYIVSRAIIACVDCKLSKSPLISADFISLLFVLAVIISVAATYEVMLGIGANAEGREEGFIWSRATAFLYNPNILGFWAVVGIMLSALAFHICAIQFYSLLLISGILSYLLILSGSRSAFLVMITILSSSSLALLMYFGRRLLHFIPLGVVFLWISIIGITSVLAENTKYVGQSNLTINLKENTCRFIMIPKAVSRYLIGTNPTTWEEEKSRTSIDGRLNIGLGQDRLFSDNNYIPIIELSGELSFASWLLVWILMIMAAAIQSHKAPSVLRVYAFSTLFGLFIAGMFTRLSFISPTWYISSILIGCAIGVSYMNIQPTHRHRSTLLV